MPEATFKYGLKFRPAGIGAVPNIPHQVESSTFEDDIGRHLTRHGVLVTERPLSEREILSFELAVIADEVIKEELVLAIAQDMGDYAAEYLAMQKTEPSNFIRNVTKSLARIRPYRVYVGDVDIFSAMVTHQLETIASQLEHSAGIGDI